MLTANRRQHDARPEPLAIFAHTEALLLVPPVHEGLLELALRLAGSDIFVAKKQRVVTSQYLSYLVPLDALGSRVPRGDVTFGIEHVDGVVLHRLHQK